MHLASASPRRAQMIREVFPEAHCAGIEGVDETPIPGDVKSQVLSICKKKAAAVTGEAYDLVIVADTMLADPDEFDSCLGKPADSVEAAMMLHRLSGRRHQVISATGLRVQGQWSFFTEIAIVEIDELTDEELVELVISESWKGKAGGYDLAGPMGKHAKLVEGDEATVLGLAGEAMQLIRELAHIS